jgi:hypothetical protein
MVIGWAAMWGQAVSRARAGAFGAKVSLWPMGILRLGMRGGGL